MSESRKVTDCICPECQVDLLIGEHVPGCGYILTAKQERFMDALAEVLCEIEIPADEPAGRES